MNTDSTSMYAGIMLLVMLIAMQLSGCAATSTTMIDEEVVTNQKPMASYTSLIIREFTLKSALFTDSADAGMDERDRRYSQIPKQLAEQIQRYLRSRQIYESVTLDGTPSRTTLVLQGRFTRMGRFRISLEATLIDGGSGQEVAFFRQTLWDVFDATETVNSLGKEVAGFIDRIQYK
jgi:hypothetical protein